MKILTRFGRSCTIGPARQQVPLLVTLAAPIREKEKARSPITLVPVIDISSSMRGPELEAAQDALARLSVHLRPGDRLGLVAFDEHARVLMPLTDCSWQIGATLRRIARGLVAGHGTNLGAGLLAGLDLLAAAPGESGRRCLILLTDGQASCGPALERDDLVALVRESSRGARVSAFGYGPECDHDGLSGIADAAGGSYAFIEGADDVLGAFSRELGGLVSIYASDLQLEVEVDGQVQRTRLDDLPQGGDARRLFHVTIEPRRAPGDVDVGAVRVSFRDALGRAQTAGTLLRACFEQRHEDGPEDPEVARVSDELRLAEAQRRADKLAREGDLGSAWEVLERALGTISDQRLRDLLEHVLLPIYADPNAYAEQAAIRVTAHRTLAGHRQLTFVREVHALLAPRGTDDTDP
jgi:uncharacterized protein YegL